MLRAYCKIVTSDYHEWTIQSFRMVAYLARYAPGLGLASSGMPVEHWPLRRIRAFVKMTSDIVTKENKAGSGKGMGPAK